MIVVLIVIFTMALGGFAVIKSYLSQLSRTYDQSSLETIAPEDEYFDTDESDDSLAKDMDTGIDQGNKNNDSDTSAKDTFIDSNDVAWDFIERADESEDSPDTDMDTDIDQGNENNDTDTSAEVTSIDPNDVAWDFIERIEDDHLINILLVGQDRREGESRQRSDTMILCSINLETGETSLISFLRDLYVQIPGGYSANRLNATYAFGGFDLLDATLTENFGVSIDGNFEVDFTGFKAIIDMLGGIDIELTSAEATYMNTRGHSLIVAGFNHLDGAEALTYARIRKIDSDFARTDRQRKVLLAVYELIDNLPIGDLLSLLYNVLPYITTDLTDTEILSLAYKLLPVVSSISINSYTVPADDCYYNARIQGMAVLVPDLQRIRQYLEEEYLPLN